MVLYNSLIHVDNFLADTLVRELPDIVNRVVIRSYEARLALRPLVRIYATTAFLSVSQPWMVLLPISSMQ